MPYYACPKCDGIYENRFDADGCCRKRRRIPRVPDDAVMECECCRGAGFVASFDDCPDCRGRGLLRKKAGVQP